MVKCFRKKVQSQTFLCGFDKKGKWLLTLTPPNTTTSYLVPTLRCGVGFGTQTAKQSHFDKFVYFGAITEYLKCKILWYLEVCAFFVPEVLDGTPARV